jgi:hypothetical protein
MITSRRSFITGLIAFTASSPAIVRAASLMRLEVLDWREVARLCTIETTIVPSSFIYFQNRRLFFVNVDQPHIIRYSPLGYERLK